MKLFMFSVPLLMLLVSLFFSMAYKVKGQEENTFVKDKCLQCSLCDISCTDMLLWAGCSHSEDTHREITSIRRLNSHNMSLNTNNESILLPVCLFVIWLQGGACEEFCVYVTAAGRGEVRPLRR